MKLSRIRQRGVTLIEVGIALFIMALVSGYVVQMQIEAAEALRSKGAAERMVQVTEASRKFIRTYYGPLATQTAGGAMIQIPVGRTTAAGPIPTGPGGLPSVQGGGFLPSNYVDLNAYAQNHVLLVRQPDPAGQPGVLEALITTTGGRPIRDKELARAATMVGATGGFMPSSASFSAGTNIVGTFAGWQADPATWNNIPATGRLMSTLAFENDSLLTDYLYRFDIGVPEANRMYTDVDMNSSNIDRALSVIAQRRLVAGYDQTDPTIDPDTFAPAGLVWPAGYQTAGANTGIAAPFSWTQTEASVGLVDTGTGVRIQQIGDVLASRDGQFGNNLRVGATATSTAGTGNVDVLNNVTACQSNAANCFLRIGATAAAGGSFFIDTANSQLSYDAASLPLGVRGAGNRLFVDGRGVFGNGGPGVPVLPGDGAPLMPGGARTWQNTGVQATNVAVTNSLATVTGGTVTGSITSDGFARFQDVYIANRNDLPVSALMPQFVARASYIASDGNTVPKPNCDYTRPDGSVVSTGQPRIIVTPHRHGIRPSSFNISGPSGGFFTLTVEPGGGFFGARAVDSGANWTVELVNFGPYPGVTPIAVATSYCYYP